MEDTLEKLVEGTNALSSDNMYTNIKDAMDSLIHTSVMEECACLPPDSEDVNKLLKIIVSWQSVLVHVDFVPELCKMLTVPEDCKM